MPLVAPTPVPTMTAVGVAKPKAQGQAIANTEMAIWKANSMMTSILAWYSWFSMLRKCSG